MKQSNSTVLLCHSKFLDVDVVLDVVLTFSGCVLDVSGVLDVVLDVWGGSGCCCGCLKGSGCSFGCLRVVHVVLDVGAFWMYFWMSGGFWM